MSTFKDKDYELEYLRLENEKLKRQLLNKNEYVDMDQIQEVLNLAVQMRELLIQCRTQQIQIGLAKRIDSILKEAKKYD